MSEKQWLVVFGILNAVGAALASTAVMAIMEAQSLRDATLGALLLPLYGVFVFSWYVIPLGALLGALLPKAVAGRTRGNAVMIGICVGAVVAAASALVYQGVTVYWPVTRPNVEVVDWSAFWTRFWYSTMRLTAAFAPICIAWSAVAAAYLQRRQEAF